MLAYQLAIHKTFSNFPDPQVVTDTYPSNLPMVVSPVNLGFDIERDEQALELLARLGSAVPSTTELSADAEIFAAELLKESAL